MTAPSGYDPHAHPPFAVTADVVVLTEDLRRVVLVERGNEPFKGAWALPGGFVDIDEDLADAATRELAEETGLELSSGQLHQLAAYGTPGRDPRMRVVSVAFWVSVADLPEPRGGSDAAAAFLQPVEGLMAEPDRLAFDHHTIIGDALRAARSLTGA
jgi:8-oxo-dGTP diphosphatase